MQSNHININHELMRLEMREGEEKSRRGQGRIRIEPLLVLAGKRDLTFEKKTRRIMIIVFGQ